MPVQDEDESIRTGSSIQKSEHYEEQDQIGTGFFKLTYRLGDEKGTSFKRKQEDMLIGKLAASNYFRGDSPNQPTIYLRKDSVPELQQEQEPDSASDWYGSVNNQQN